MKPSAAGDGMRQWIDQCFALMCTRLVWLPNVPSGSKPKATAELCETGRCSQSFLNTCGNERTKTNLIRLPIFPFLQATEIK